MKYIIKTYLEDDYNRCLLPVGTNHNLLKSVCQLTGLYKLAYLRNRHIVNLF